MRPPLPAEPTEDKRLARTLEYLWPERTAPTVPVGTLSGTRSV